MSTGWDAAARRHVRQWPLTEFRPSDVEYSWSPERGIFMHQFDRDLHLVVLWSGARAREEEILELIEKDFTVLGTFAVRWSAARMVNNFERLYARPLNGSFIKHQQVGDGEFLAVVIEDPAPAYSYLPNVSGFVEPTNVNVAALKVAARKLAGGFRVHSSNSIQEFFRDATLVLGVDRVDDLLQQKAPSRHVQRIRDDLVGSEGWADLRELFRTLQRTSEYVVLRNYESLPDTIDEGDDIDVLCMNPTAYVGLLNGVKEHPGSQGARYSCRVGRGHVIFDVRYVGDGYLDGQWQREILRRRGWHQDIVAVPRVDDYFFSLLYHAKVQKPEVKADYVPRLAEAATKIGVPPEQCDRVSSDEVAAPVLDGFLAASDYSVPRPVDRGVFRNEAFLARFVLTQPEPSPIRTAVDELWTAARRGRVGRTLGKSALARRFYRRIVSAVRG